MSNAPGENASGRRRKFAAGKSRDGRRRGFFGLAATRACNSNKPHPCFPNSYRVRDVSRRPPPPSPVILREVPGYVVHSFPPHRKRTGRRWAFKRRFVRGVSFVVPSPRTTGPGSFLFSYVHDRHSWRIDQCRARAYRSRDVIDCCPPYTAFGFVALDARAVEFVTVTAGPRPVP